MPLGLETLTNFFRDLYSDDKPEPKRSPSTNRQARVDLRQVPRTTSGSKKVPVRTRQQEIQDIDRRGS